MPNRHGKHRCSTNTATASGVTGGLVAAAEQLPEGLVLDGELVVWDTAAGRLSFEALQRRAAARGRTATALPGKSPAFFIAFDALEIDGIELLALPYMEWRRRLEVLFAARTLTAPWTLCFPIWKSSGLRDWGSDGVAPSVTNQRPEDIDATAGEGEH
ncbi:hypothetical protein HET69_42480, partial [Streptomyces sp. CJ_13]|nr:hypothetical protein [Streptomyces sp. CJ_13]